ncbi:cupin domain-containing protein [Glycomyces sp. A-F 0318]|uniref:cupin domain-containing protein n=1 Tax=Glycomyces amatae TaxID=2881355 RepID=UPI001E5C983F|nr:cupin domain-containing protein [Glycomyces amatae]MCD0442627.1 cupin domain-containing protein [Glycomyces amatae]
MTHDRFLLLSAGERRPGRAPMPSAFSVKASTEDTEGRLSILEVTVALPIPRHIHHRADECVYVLAGELTVEIEGETRTAGPGDFVLLPRGVPHALRPGSAPPPRVLQISAPGGWERALEDMFAARSGLASGGALDPAKLNAATEPHGITYL